MSISHLLRCASTMALNKIGQFKQLSAARMSGESWDCARLQKFYPQATEPLLDALSDGATSCAKTVQIVKNLSLGRAQKCAHVDGKMCTTPCIPRRSPIQVLTWPDVA